MKAKARKLRKYKIRVGQFIFTIYVRKTSKKSVRYNDVPASYRKDYVQLICNTMLAVTITFSALILFAFIIIHFN